MKKINTLLILFSFILISCSDDDSSGSNNEDIIGKWEITELQAVATFEGPDGTEEEQVISSTTENCDPAPTWEFMSNGNFEATEFDVDLTDSSCDVGDVTSDATWEEIGNNTVKINEESTNETITLDVNYTGNNKAEVNFEQTEGEAVIVSTFFLTRL